MDWNDKTQVKKGNIGETIIDRFFIEKNLIPYGSICNKAHPFDRLVASSDKQNIYIAEIKTKARRTYYPDTGFNYTNYKQYENIMQKHSIKVFIFFVDEWQEKVYGNFLDILSQETIIEHGNRELVYPLISKGIIYFPLKKMRTICNINKEEAEKLKELSRRNHDYPQEVC